jgi:predicted Zn-dependent peptidase
MGAHYNAFTNEENTVFYAAVLPEYQSRAVDLLGDILRPSLRQEDFDTEKKVILEEIEMYEDQPPFGADDKCRAAWFGPHPLGHSVLGTAESVEALGVEQMRGYFQRRYTPGNIVLAAAGRIDFDGLVAAAGKSCGHWQPGDNSRLVEPPVPHPGFLSLSKASATQQYVMQLAAGPAARDSDRRAAKLLSVVLGDDSGSRLYWELVDPGRAESCQLSHHEYQGAGVLLTCMSCAPEATEENLRLMAEVYRRAAAEGVAPAELDQAKSKIRSRLVLSGERPRGRLFAVGSDWVYRGQYRAVEEELEAVAAVTADDLSAVLAKHRLDCSTTITIGPLGEFKSLVVRK